MSVEKLEYHLKKSMDYKTLAMQFKQIDFEKYIRYYNKFNYHVNRYVYYRNMINGILGKLHENRLNPQGYMGHYPMPHDGM